MPVHVRTSDRHDFALDDTTSLETTRDRIQTAMEEKSVIQLDLATGHVVCFNAAQVGWAVVLDTDVISEDPPIVDLTTMLLTEGGGGGPAAGGGPRPG
jgi:hypothetical protein